MTAPEGAFYSAEDADSEGEEGKFYVWTAPEIEEVFEEAGIPIPDRKLLVEFWDVSVRGNFEGKIILNERLPRDRFLPGAGKSEDEWESLIQKARMALLARRSKRIRPLRDDKILTSWNALYISALAQAATAFADRGLYDRARRAADFIRDTMHAADGSLYRRYREGEAGIAATLPDYALLANAHLDLYRAGHDPEDFARARDLAAQIRENFADPKGSGAFFETRADSADLIVRVIETYDGVEPSGNAAAARLFLTLALYGEEPAENRGLAEGVFRYCKTAMSEQGASHSYLGVALMAYLQPSPEIAIVAPNGLPSDADSPGSPVARRPGRSQPSLGRNHHRDYQRGRSGRGGKNRTTPGGTHGCGVGRATADDLRVPQPSVASCPYTRPQNCNRYSTSISNLKRIDGLRLFESLSLWFRSEKGVVAKW